MTQFDNDKTSRMLFLEISRIKISNKEKVKDFNYIFIALLNKIFDKLAKEVQIEFYTIALSPPVSMFLKRKEKENLAKNFVEAIKVEKDLATISNHLENEESEASTSENNGNKNKNIESDGKDRVILKLQNKIINIKRSKGEGKKPLKKRTNTNTSPQVPRSSSIDFENYVMDNFCRTHYENHLEKTCPEFINSLKGMLIP